MAIDLNKPAPDTSPGRHDTLLRRTPGSQTELLPPSPLRTARTGFPISSSSLSNARRWTRLIHRHTPGYELYYGTADGVTVGYSTHRCRHRPAAQCDGYAIQSVW